LLLKEISFKEGTKMGVNQSISDKKGLRSSVGSRLALLRRERLGFLALLLLALLLGFDPPIRSSQEIFPFYSWSMYSTVPNIEVFYSVTLISTSDLNIGPDSDLRESGIKGTETALCSHIVQQLGRSIATRNTGNIKKWRHQLERLYLPEGTLYQVISEKQTPMQRWKKESGEAVVLAMWWRAP